MTKDSRSRVEVAVGIFMRNIVTKIVGLAPLEKNDAADKRMGKLAKRVAADVPEVRFFEANFSLVKLASGEEVMHAPIYWAQMPLFVFGKAAGLYLLGFSDNCLQEIVSVTEVIMRNALDTLLRDRHPLDSSPEQSARRLERHCSEISIGDLLVRDARILGDESKLLLSMLTSDEVEELRRVRDLRNNVIHRNLDSLRRIYEAGHSPNPFQMHDFVREHADVVGYIASSMRMTVKIARIARDIYSSEKNLKLFRDSSLDDQCAILRFCGNQFEAIRDELASPRTEREIRRRIESGEADGFLLMLPDVLRTACVEWQCMWNLIPISSPSFLRHSPSRKRVK